MRPSTYSLVACDLARGEWGVAVQSKFLAVGSLVPWAEPGVGAVVTQALARVSYGPDGLSLLRSGHAAGAVVERLTTADPGRGDRQLGVVDGLGRSATFTGVDCLPWAGGLTGPGFAAQGNLLVSEETIAALARTFEQTAGAALADRLLASLQEGQRAGGDRRGQQSAALLVVKRGGGYDGSDVMVDLRVDDHASPIVELERLYGLHQRYFGVTPADEWLAVAAPLAAELRRLLSGLGYDSGGLASDLERWAAIENLEERVDGAERVDPVVLEALRAAAGAGS